VFSHPKEVRKVKGSIEKCEYTHISYTYEKQKKGLPEPQTKKKIRNIVV